MRTRAAHLEALDFLAGCRAETLHLVRHVSQAQLDTAPPSGGWSVGEVLSHLLIVEDKIRSQFALLVQLHDAGDRPELVWEFTANSTVPVWIPKELVPVMGPPFEIFNAILPRQVAEYLIRFPVFRFRAADWATPEKALEGDGLRSRLRGSLEQTRGVLESKPERPWEEFVVRHPSLGVNSVPQMLRIVGHHEHRHQQQIQRILAGVG